MRKIVRLTENDLMRIVRKVIKEQRTDDLSPHNDVLNPQEQLYKFLKGVSQMSRQGVGWKPSTGVSDKYVADGETAPKLTINMLGKYVSAYSSLGGDKVQIGKPLTWELYPLDPTKKAPGVRCNLVQYGGSFSVALYGGDAPIGYESGGFITEPGNVEKYLSELRKVSEFYQKRMRNSPR